jgi:hypothetical protein
MQPVGLHQTASNEVIRPERSHATSEQGERIKYHKSQQENHIANSKPF